MTPYAGGRLTFYNQEVVGQAISNGPDAENSLAHRADRLTTNRLRQQMEGGVLLEARAARVYTPRRRWQHRRARARDRAARQLHRDPGINQKANPQWEPGGGPTTRVEPGYEARTGIDAVNKANEVTYQLTNRLNARTTVRAQRAAGPAGSWRRLTVSQTYNFLPVSEPFKDLVAEAIVQPNEHLRFARMPGAMSTAWGLGRQRGHQRHLPRLLGERGTALQRAAGLPLPAGRRVRRGCRGSWTRR